VYLQDRPSDFFIRFGREQLERLVAIKPGIKLKGFV